MRLFSIMLLVTVTVLPFAVVPPARAAACAESGQVIDVVIPTGLLSRDVTAKVYLPPCYNSMSAHYPVLYLLNGRNNTADQWLRIGVPDVANSMMGNSVAPFIIVMPEDRMERNFDRALVQEIVPFIDANFRTLPNREHRALGGLSHGGGWALHIGLEHAELFSRVGGHSPDLFVGDDANLLEWGRRLTYPLSISIDIGDQDSMVACCASALDQLLDRAEVPHAYTLNPGGHTESYWAAHLGGYLSFYSHGW